MFRLRRAPIAVMLVALLWVGSSAAADDLVGVDGAGFSPTSLYHIDPLTGAIIALIGPTGVDDLNAIDFDPTTGSTVLYGIGNDLGVADGFGWPVPVLGTLDLTFGTFMPLVDVTGIASDGVCNPNVSDISINSLGEIFAWSPCPAELYEIDKVTGVATLVATLAPFSFQIGIAFDSLDTLWVKEGGALFSVDLITPAFLPAAPMTVGLDNALEFDPFDTALTVNRLPDGGVGGGGGEGGTVDTELLSLDLISGMPTLIDLIGSPTISGLAFGFLPGSGGSGGSPGPTGPTGPTGATGFPGPPGLDGVGAVPGALLLLPIAVPGPDGYTLLGRINLQGTSLQVNAWILGVLPVSGPPGTSEKSSGKSRQRARSSGKRVHGPRRPRARVNWQAFTASGVCSRIV